MCWLADPGERTPTHEIGEAMDERLRPWMLIWSHTSTPSAIKRMVEEARKSIHVPIESG
jgi:hypothetical protein